MLFYYYKDRERFLFHKKTRERRGMMKKQGSGLRGRTIIVLLMAIMSFGFLFSEEAQDPSILNLDRIFSKEFEEKVFGPAVWMERRSGYTVLEKEKDKDGRREIVFYDVETGRREVLVPAWRLTPPSESSPLSIENYAWSRDAVFLLIFANTKARIRQRHTGGLLGAGHRHLGMAEARRGRSPAIFDERDVFA